MDYYTVSDISKMLGISEETVRRWIRSGKLKARQKSRKSGNTVSESDLQKFLKSMPKYASITSRGLITSLTGIGLSFTLSGFMGELLVGYLGKGGQIQNSSVTQTEIIRYLHEQLSLHKKAALRKRETIAKLQEELELEEQQIASLQDGILQIKALQVKED